MANSYLDTSLVDKAIKFAVDAHSNTERRGKGFPYVIHVMEAMEIAATITNDPEILAAAALHDTVEDTAVTLDQIHEEFGSRVAEMVDWESDKMAPGAGENECDSWRDRKKAAIDRLARAPHDAKIVAMGDKLSNMRAIARDYRVSGDGLWSIFHAPGGKADHKWHYQGLVNSLQDLVGTPAYEEFSKLVDEVFCAEEYAPELINLGEYELSGGGFTAESYNHEDGRRMMKLYADFVPKAEISREFNAAKTVSALGVKSPEAYRIITDGRRYGVEFQRILNKKSYSRLIADEPSKLEEYATRFANECKALHALKCDTDVFNSVSEHFRRAVKASKQFDENVKRNILGFIDSVPEMDTCLHGDLHIGNLIVSEGENYWIDLGAFMYGNPCYDLGMMYFNAYIIPDENVEDLYHISRESYLKVWETFVKVYFDGRLTMEQANELSAPFAALNILYFGVRGSIYPEMVEFVAKQFENARTF